MENENKIQFDNYLGGETSLPNDVNIFKFAAARANEIAFMENALKNPSNNKLIFQKLPLHMRRRVMSHNAKRLPRRLRAGHLNQLAKAGMPPKQKRPSRKYRRRPANLQTEYVRRQRRVQWLETHIWHAKRFHMVERWGHKIPDRPCDKSFRALYRASAKHCLLQDISYYHCIEINGDKSIILSKFKLMTSPETGLSIGAKCFINGNREGQIVLYHCNTYPNNVIGNVKFLWKPYLNAANQESTLWLWAHPSFSAEIINELQKQNNDNKNNSIEIKDLRYDFSRFKLTGPLSHSVLKKSLNLANESNITDNSWFKKFINTNCEQNKYWNELYINSTSELPPSSVINVVVVDPRFNMPKKRTKSINNTDEEYQLLDINSIPSKMDSINPIWNANVRQECLTDKLSSADICKLKSEQLVPGEDNAIIHKLASTPILIIQQPGNQDSYIGYGSGYDIIIPTGWGLPLWRTLIMWGARAGGLREDRVSILENQLNSYLYPDSNSGELENKRIEQAYRERYFKLPPKKRVNFNKIGMISPFRPRWNILVNDWLPVQKENCKFYILRNISLLKLLQSALSKSTNVWSEQIMNESMLVPVKINLLNRGTIRDIAIICLPNETDSSSNEHIIQEELHKDVNRTERKKLRKTHLKLLKRLKRIRVRVHRKWKESIEPTEKPIFKSTAPLIEKHREQIQQLWLPEPTSIRNACSRQTIGFVTCGDYSFTNGKSLAVGYVTVQSLQFIKNKLVLVRDKNNRCYRYAYLNINI